MGLRENILREPISVLQLRPYAAVTADATVRQAVEAMRDKQIGAAMIVDEAGKTLGMFNEKMLIRLLINDPTLLDEPVEKHMTTNIFTVQASDPIARLISTMQNRRLRWVSINDAEGRPTALTGLRGVVEYVADYFPHQVKVQPIDGSKVSIKTREGA
ncbi:CBS domain-containing protein [Planctomycetales bacterium ZRK34]|nr:CBS domain-containing protein [Planctomycetales bacterium ZRK34]